MSTLFPHRPTLPQILTRTRTFDFQSIMADVNPSEILAELATMVDDEQKVCLKDLSGTAIASWIQA